MVAWEDFAGRLWRARSADGFDKIQLTPNDLEFSQRNGLPMAPAGHHGPAFRRDVADLLVSGRRETELLMKDDRNVADPGWSAMGRDRFGREPDSMGKESGCVRSNYSTCKAKRGGLCSFGRPLQPALVADGKWIAALSLAQDK